MCLLETTIVVAIFAALVGAIRHGLFTLDEN